MSTVVDVASADDADDDGEGEKPGARDPFGDAAIEVDDETLRRVSPGAWIGHLTERLDDLGRRLIYGR